MVRVAYRLSPIRASSSHESAAGEIGAGTEGNPRPGRGPDGGSPVVLGVAAYEAGDAGAPDAGGMLIGGTEPVGTAGV